MRNVFGMIAAAVASIARGLGLASAFGIGGVFTVDCYAAEGTLRWSRTLKNGVTSAGLNHVLDIVLRGQTQVSSWYIGLIDNSGYSALAVGDTMASHAGWSEAATYTESTRPQWSPGAASSQSVVNGTTVDFTMNASKTIRGLFLTSANDKSGTTGTLFSTASFSGGNQAVNSGDTLKVTYTVSAAAA